MLGKIKKRRNSVRFFHFCLRTHVGLPENYPQDIRKGKDTLLRYLYDGKYISGPNGGFTDAYFFNPTEIEKFMSGFGLRRIKIMATDPFGIVEDKLSELS